MYDSSLISKYLSIKALAEKGVGGELDSAVKRLKAFQIKYPGIQEQAARAEQAARHQQANAHGTPDWNWNSTHVKPTPSTQPPNDWSNVFNFISQAASTAQGFVETAYQMRQGIMLAGLVDAYTRVIKGRGDQAEQDVLIALRMPKSAYWQAKELNPIQAQAFKKAMHDKLEARLMAMFDED